MADHMSSEHLIGCVGMRRIERGIADIKAGRTVSHEAAMASLRKVIAAEEWPD
jgi:predicted transcriptional regulator